MAYCWVVEKTDWDQDVDGLQLYWEQRTILKVFMSYEDAKSFVEKDAAKTPFDMRWRGTGKTIYSGRTIDHQMKEGLDYELHYVELH